MKMIIAILISVVWTASTTSVSAKSITGHVSNPVCDSVTLTYQDGVSDIVLKRISAKLSQDGSFELSVPDFGNYKHMELMHGKQRVGLVSSPLNEVHVDFDAMDFENTLKFHGAESVVCEYLYMCQQKFGLRSRYSNMIRPFYIEHKDGFERAIYKSYKDQIAFLDKWKFNLPYSFFQFWKATLRYDYLYRLECYNRYHNVIVNNQGLQEKRQDDIQIPLEFYDEYLHIVEYRLYVQNYPFTQIKDTEAAEQSDIVDMIKSMVAKMPFKTGEFYLSGLFKKEDIKTSNAYPSLLDFFNNRYSNSNTTMLAR